MAALRSLANLYLLILIFCISVAAIFHTYVLYPFLLERFNAQELPHFEPNLSVPVDILIAAYNEESVIVDKINSILASDYPMEKVRIIIGSDGSVDRTEELVKGIAHDKAEIILIPYERSGKTTVVNRLVAASNTDLLILTDANVMFTSGTIKGLLGYFSQDEVGLVGADIRSSKSRSEGIAHQEAEYLQRENRMKYKEGVLWGTMMGAFGGCYALRRNLFTPVPEHFLVDDFHITMSILKKGYKAILSREAVCLEDISSKLSEEYRRKVRMSTGNFQNLRAFAGLMMSPQKGLSFSFISHKVLRWLTPIFILSSLFASLMLSGYSWFFLWSFYLILIGCLVPMIDLTLKSLGFQSKGLRFITYFVSMNFALLVGMIRSFKRVDRAIWQPTERNQ